MVCPLLTRLLAALLALGVLARPQQIVQALSRHNLATASYRETTVTDEAQDAARPEHSTPLQATPAAAADITVVTTPAQLQEASTSGATNIEVQSHLDLRSLRRIPSASLPKFFGGEEINQLQALFNVQENLNSLRGNCSDPDAAAALGLTLDQADTLLPLKPRQCLLLLPDTFLFSSGGAFWLDNLYLRIDRGRRRQPEASFMLAGYQTIEGNWQVDTVTMVAVTNVTMHGGNRGSINGIRLGSRGSSALVQDCIFTEWGGYTSPIQVNKESRASVVDTVFRNMRLPVEVIDVSYGSTARLQNTSLANVTLTHGRVVGTTASDYIEPQVGEGYDALYYAEDDEDIDVEVTVVAPGARGMFGEEFVIENGVVSDCLYLEGGLRNVQPGCPADTLQRRHDILERFYGPMKADNYLDLSGGVAGKEILVDTPSLASPWVAALRAPLQPLPAAPAGWPAFIVEPLDDPVARVDLSETLPVPPGLLVPSGLGMGVPPPPSRGATGGRGSEAAMSAALVAILVALAVVTTVAAVWAVRALRRPPPPPPTPPSPLLVRTAKINGWRLAGPLVSWANSTESMATHASHATSVTAVVSGNGSTVRYGSTVCATQSSFSSATESAMTRGTVPDCAMNPAYEYALPTDVARLMAGPTQDTDKIAKKNPRQGRRLFGKPRPRGGRGRRVGGAELHLELPTLAATQPWSNGSTWSARSSGHGSGMRPMSPFGSVAPPASSAPIAGAAALGPRESSLQARSVESGSEFRGQGSFDVDMARESTTGTIFDGHESPSVDAAAIEFGTETWSSHCTPPPATAALEQEVHGIRMGRVLHTDPSTGWSDWTESATAKAAAKVAAKAEVAAAAPAATDTVCGDRLIDRLQRQLDVFTEEDRFLGRFEMLGRNERRRGGQAVVQFAEDVADHSAFAVKFFLDWDSFVTEAALYAAAFPHIRREVATEVAVRADASAGIGPDGGAAVPMGQVIAKFLPQVEAVCDGTAGGLKDPRGRPLPPCIVLEKGESLHDWSDRAEPDLFTSLAVLSNLSKRLADMHDAGYVHRDLKPANVMWLPRQNRWTVIDFGCVARVGEEAPLQFTVAYAAPEVIRCYFLKQYVIEPTPALDAWSLGVMAFELLTGAPAFDVLADGRARVMQRLRGDLPLPWEGELCPTAKNKLGLFREPVLQLLHRDPGRRTSMRAFHTTCTKLFAARTTMEA